MRRSLLRLTLTVVVAWGAASAIIAGAPVGVTAPLGLLLVVLSGFSWLRAVHPRPLPALETFTAVTAVALGLLVTTALVLDRLPGGLRPTSWAIALALLVSVGESIAAARSDAGPGVLVRLPRPTARQVIAIVLGIAALTGAGAVSIVSANSSDEEHFTELSLVPGGASRNPTSAVLLVTNRENADVRYRLDYATGTRVIEYKMTLRTGASFRRVEPVRRGAASATLYRESARTPYRHVWIGTPKGRRVGG